ncbi:hypothetical protein DM860_015782 [Cuscuta australis]|uniref:Uncharacterized protein n=1 Tax=Cuscuta australis TaxID=267555 RepID=A0A328DY27_9ASTE|nr:hypothetical protein DM860_015782 [Cuscuta australis]
MCVREVMDCRDIGSPVGAEGPCQLLLQFQKRPPITFRKLRFSCLKGHGSRIAASNYMRKAGETHGTVEIHISIGDGPGRGVAWGCDLSYDYVKINAEYST